MAVGVAVLLISAGLEATSWRRARRQLRSEAAARHLDLGEYLVTSSDPTPTAVFLEDSAALVGIALALAALVLHITTGSALWDGAASLLIGLLLIAVAVRADAPQPRVADRRGGPGRHPRAAAPGGGPGAVGGRGGRADRGVHRPQAPAGAGPCCPGRRCRPAREHRPAAPQLLAVPAIAAAEITPIRAGR